MMKQASTAEALGLLQIISRMLACMEAVEHADVPDDAWTEATTKAQMTLDAHGLRRCRQAPERGLPRRGARGDRRRGAEGRGAAAVSDQHATVPVLVWADVDVGIADFVRYLNTLPGIRTHASCQGTIGEGGAQPYGPQVMVSWEDDAARAGLAPHTVKELGPNFGYAYPAGPVPSGEELSLAQPVVDLLYAFDEGLCEQAFAKADEHGRVPAVDVYPLIRDALETGARTQRGDYDSPPPPARPAR